MVASEERVVPESTTDVEQMVQRYRRRGTRWYRYLSPPLPLVHNPAERQLPDSGTGHVLLIGGAAQATAAHVINLDIVAAPGVDVVADAAALPFADGQFARIECDAVLEHVPNPDVVVAEVRRTLARGGYAHLVVPFNHPYHGYPRDYHRWTRLGFERLIHPLEVVDAGVRTGPAATWLLTTLQFVKLVVPGASGRLLGAAVGWVLWPVRYVDLWLYRRDDAHVLANSLYVLARKPDE